MIYIGLHTTALKPERPKATRASDTFPLSSEMRKPRTSHWLDLKSACAREAVREPLPLAHAVVPRHLQPQNRAEKLQEGRGNVGDVQLRQ